MLVRVKFFASLREQVGQSDRRLDVPQGARIPEIWELATQEQAIPANVLVAVNMEYVDLDATVEEGDEVAFFPPVTGG